MPIETEDRRTFVRRESIGLQAAGFIAGGILFLLLLAVNFLALIIRPARPGDSLMPGLIGGVSVIGIGLIARGLFLLRATVRVVLDAAGIQLETLTSRLSLAWAEVDRIEFDKRSSLMGGETLRVARIIGRNGKRLAEISETVGDFDALAAELTARSSAAAGRGTYDAGADERRRVERDARKIKRVAWAFAFFTAGMAAALCAGIHEELHVRRFASEGVRVDAKIVRRWMYRVTPHIEYSFQDSSGHSYSKDAMMYPGPAWDALEGARTVPVEYLRSDPSWNRLTAGESPGAQFGGKFLLVSTGGLVMFGTLFVFAFLGFDLKVENGVTTLVRYGRPIRTWGTPTR
jgi:hypothetical protein